MITVETDFLGIKLIRSNLSEDDRGFNTKFYSDDDLIGANIDFKPIEILSLHSNKNTLRGLHYQKTYEQSRMINCMVGELFVVAVDMRSDSVNLGKHSSYILNSSQMSLYIPRGFAVGTFAIRDSQFLCLCGDNKYMPEDATGIIWNDRYLNIKWPCCDEKVIISCTDSKLPLFEMNKS